MVIDNKRELRSALNTGDALKGQATMSDKLIVEFYDDDLRGTPEATVLACYGGDNPSSAATTLADFFDALITAGKSGTDDAGLLAAKFVVWQAAQESGEENLDFTGVSIIQKSPSTELQVAKVVVRDGAPSVSFARNKYATPRELAEASLILRGRICS